MTSPVLISETQADLADNESSTAQTVREMGGHIRGALSDPLVVATAQQAAADGIESPGSRRQIADAIWRWCKFNIRFVPDEVQLKRLLNRDGELELLISPSVMLRPELLGKQQMEGDCDCFVMTADAFLACLGVPPVIKTFKCDADEPWRWSHVCAGVVLEDGSFYPVDASHGDYPGWEVPREHVYQSQLWDMNGNRVGGGMGNVKRRGLGHYSPQPGWTGNPMTASSNVGPYPQLDVMRYWQPMTCADRLKGLQGIARAKFGLGDLTCVGYTNGECTAYQGSDLGSSGATPTLDQMLQNDTGAGGSSSFDLNSLLAQLTGAGAKLGAQALATPGTTILPNGTIVAGTPQGTSALNLSSAGISTGLLVALGLGLVLVFALKK